VRFSDVLLVSFVPFALGCVADEKPHVVEDAAQDSSDGSAEGFDFGVPDTSYPDTRWTFPDAPLDGFDPPFTKCDADASSDALGASHRCRRRTTPRSRDLPSAANRRRLGTRRATAGAPDDTDRT